MELPGPRAAPEVPAPFPTDPWYRSAYSDQTATVKTLNRDAFSGSYRVAIRYPSSTNQVTKD